MQKIPSVFHKFQQLACLSGLAWAVSGCSLMPSAKPEPSEAQANKPPTVFSGIDWERLRELSNRTAPSPVTASPVPEPANASSVQTKVKAPASTSTSTSIVVEPPPSEASDVAVMANQCWAQMVIKPRPTQSTQNVVVQDGRDSHRVTPEQRQTKAEAFRIQEAATTYKVVEPRFRTVTESVKVSDESRRMIVEPAVYSEKQEQVMVESERIEMRACRSAGMAIAGQRNAPTQQTLCAVTVPATYTTITKRVLVKPETLREEITPAVYKNITKMILVDDGKALPVEVPPKYTQLSVSTTVAPPQAQKTEIAPVLQDVTVKLHEGAPRLAWRRVVCEKEATPSMVRQLQENLLRKGFTIGVIDGKLGDRTLSAIDSYQQQNGLASGFLTFEVLQSLGVRTE